MKKVCVAIINWNGLVWLKKNLPAIQKFSNEAKIIVIDNNSTDNSKNYIKNKFKNIELIEHNKNYGFSEGYNRALKKIKTKYVLLLNNDVLVSKNWIQPLLSFLEKNQDFSVVQPKILDLSKKTHFEYAGAAGGFIDYNGIPFCRGRIGDKIEKDMGQYNSSSAIFWASGACFLINREIFLKVGGFDQNFNMHQEEIDLCWRIQGLGKKIGYCPKSTVFHYGGGTLSKSDYKKIFYNHRNNLIMLFKNLPIFDLIIILINRIVIDLLIALKYLIKLNIHYFFTIILAYISFVFLIPRYLFINKKINEKRKAITRKVEGRYNINIILLVLLKYDKFSKLLKK
tara:strand:- start:422 stop:1444 length:1023 start_codon:yes stop_codon:yes gene_type:complete